MISGIEGGNTAGLVFGRTFPLADDGRARCSWVLLKYLRNRVNHLLLRLESGV